jgi:hypothetical protein
MNLQDKLKLLGKIPDLEVVDNAITMTKNKWWKYYEINAGDLVLVVRGNYVWNYGIFASKTDSNDMNVQIGPKLFKVVSPVFVKLLDNKNTVFM